VDRVARRSGWPRCDQPIISAVASLAEMTDAVSDALDWALDRLNGKLPFLDHLARRYLRRN
jgi:hypothetical protein